MVNSLGLESVFIWALVHGLRILGNLVIPTLTAAWEHEYFYSALAITASFVEFPGTKRDALWSKRRP